MTNGLTELEKQAITVGRRAWSKAYSAGEGTTSAVEAAILASFRFATLGSSTPLEAPASRALTRSDEDSADDLRIIGEALSNADA